MRPFSAFPFERRQHPRFAALSPALVVGAQGLSGPCLVEDLSAGGARISGGPALKVGEAVCLLLQLPGRAPFSMHGTVVRCAKSSQGSVAFGIAFTHSPAHSSPKNAEEMVLTLQKVKSLVAPMVLVVHASIQGCCSLVQGLQGIGRRSIAVTTPLDAIEWLLGHGTHFESALVDIFLGHASGCDVLSFLADEYPQVKRIVVSDPLHAAEVQRTAHVTKPWGVLHTPWDDGQLGRLFGEPMPRVSKIQ